MVSYNTGRTWMKTFAIHQMTLLREIFSKQMLSKRKVIIPIITTKVPLNMVASVFLTVHHSIDLFQ